MASTITTIVSEFRRKYPDCSAAHAAELFKRAHQELVAFSSIRSSVAYITLDGTSSEFTLAEAVTKVDEVYYERSSDPNDWLYLMPTTKAALRVNEPGWRATDSSGEPTRFYVDSAVSSDSAVKVIGFDPTPATATSGTYPRVAVYGGAYADLTGSETVPTSILNDHVYIWRMYYFWAVEMKKREDAEYWKRQSDDELGRNIHRINSIVTHAENQQVPSMISGMSNVV